MSGTEYLPLWRYIAKLEAESLEGWRKAQASHLDLEQFLTQRVTAVESTVSRKPGGSTSVTISLLAKKALDCEVNYFHLQRAANRLFELVEPPSSRS